MELMARAEQGYNQISIISMIAIIALSALAR